MPTAFPLKIYWGGPIGKRALSSAEEAQSGDLVLIEALRSSARFVAGDVRPLYPSARVIPWPGVPTPQLKIDDKANGSNLIRLDSQTRIAIVAAALARFLSLELSTTEGKVLVDGKTVSTINVPDAVMFDDEAVIVRDAIKASHQLHAFEGIAQILDSLEFLLASFGVTSRQCPYTVEALEVGLQVLSAAIHAMKHAFHVPRPHTRRKDIVPFLPVPAHMSFPGGHAAYAALCVELLAAISSNSNGRAAADKMALLVATNRVVAGLHYPLDSSGGEVLAGGLAYWLIATASAQHGTVSWWETQFTKDAAQQKMKMLRVSGNVGTVDVDAWRWLVNRAKQEW